LTLSLSEVHYEHCIVLLISSNHCHRQKQHDLLPMGQSILNASQQWHRFCRQRQPTDAIQTGLSTSWCCLAQMSVASFERTQSTGDSNANFPYASIIIYQWQCLSHHKIWLHGAVNGLTDAWLWVKTMQTEVYTFLPLPLSSHGGRGWLFRWLTKWVPFWTKRKWDSSVHHSQFSASLTHRQGSHRRNMAEPREWNPPSACGDSYWPELTSWHTGRRRWYVGRQKQQNRGCRGGVHLAWGPIPSSRHQQLPQPLWDSSGCPCPNPQPWNSNTALGQGEGDCRS